MERPFIVGVSGKKRHGKDTVGQTLNMSRGFMQTAFADPLKIMAMDLFWLTYDQCYGGVGLDGKVVDRELVDPRWGLSPRQILQLLGTEVGRNVHTEVWVRNTLKHIEDAFAGREVNFHYQSLRTFRPVTFNKGHAARWCITDCRFPNEAEAVKAAGGIVVKVHRPGLGESGDSHASETSVDLVEEDHLLINDGTLEDLQAQVLALPFLQHRSAQVDL